MATTKNITMKQFNGTDYDTLYPKTKVEQVENLTPSSIGAVSKTGDTIEGSIVFDKGDWNQIKMILSNGGTAYFEASNYEVNMQIRDGDSTDNRRCLTLSSKQSGLNDALKIYDTTAGSTALYNVLHTGNAQSLGFPKIATGSYVGTGYSGQSHPMSINVGFAPKLFWVGLKDISAANDVMAGMMLDVGREQENGLFIYPGTKFICSPGATTKYYVTVTWGSTMRWYGYVNYDDTTHGKYQFNEAGVTYYWVAIG